MAELPIIQPSRVTVMIKPVGALCNLNCEYCYYLPTKGLYEGHEHRMSIERLEEVYASFLPRFANDVTVAWQGGEPTLAGLKFFEKAMEFQEKYRRPEQQISNALQTNGTLLNDAWCKFLNKHEFLIGLSLDGPARFHDHYRVTNRDEPSAEQVLQGLSLLRKHNVEHNILTVLNDRNVKHPDELMHYLLNLGVRYMQFIPAVEWEADPDRPGENKLAPFSPDPADYGKFLCRVFDLWFEKYRAYLSVRIIDTVLNKLVLGVTPFCILDGSCHTQMTIEHDGAVFGCDHFVQRRWQLGQIGDKNWRNNIRIDGSADAELYIHGRDASNLDQMGGRYIDAIDDVDAPSEADDSFDDTWMERLDGERLGAFAERKQRLPEKCVKCQYKPFCHGGCPKHRSQGGEIPEPTVLCESYMMFYDHAMERMEWLAGFLRRNQQPPPPGVPAEARQEAAMAARGGGGRPGRAGGAVGRNDPCPCGSGMKYKKCCGRGRS